MSERNAETQIIVNWVLEDLEYYLEYSRYPGWLREVIENDLLDQLGESGMLIDLLTLVLERVDWEAVEAVVEE